MIGTQIAHVGRMLCAFFALAVIMMSVSGCNTLPAGRLDAISPNRRMQTRGMVCLLRGWRGLWSKGIDDLAAELHGHGVEALVFRDGQWEALAQRLVCRSRNSPRDEPLVLIGFSYGADDAIRVARRLGHNGIRVDLLITIDPVTPPPVPANVHISVNYYQSNGVWDLFPWLRGVPVHGEPGGPTPLNQNLKKDRQDLQEQNTSHATIAGNARLHREIVERLRETFATRAPITAGATMGAYGRPLHCIRHGLRGDCRAVRDLL
ncbi:MAG TPA: thioesterase domain-containing protein [Tepidisphaeraceae bacterium]|nr:thioesterase domain-containing protein [Tepidisphaeraceae bacterium]